jgi:hypothetical protein
VLLSSQNEVLCFSVWLLVEKGWGGVNCQGLCTQLLLINCMHAYLALLRASKICGHSVLEFFLVNLLTRGYKFFFEVTVH